MATVKKNAFLSEKRLSEILAFGSPVKKEDWRIILSLGCPIKLNGIVEVLQGLGEQPTSIADLKKRFGITGKQLSDRMKAVNDCLKFRESSYILDWKKLPVRRKPNGSTKNAKTVKYVLTKQFHQLDGIAADILQGLGEQPTSRVELEEKYEMTEKRLSFVLNHMNETLNLFQANYTLAWKELPSRRKPNGSTKDEKTVKHILTKQPQPA